MHLQPLISHEMLWPSKERQRVSFSFFVQPMGGRTVEGAEERRDAGLSTTETISTKGTQSASAG